MAKATLDQLRALEAADILAILASGTNPDGTPFELDITELATALTLADGMANPTVPGVGAFGMIRDIATGLWSRVIAYYPPASGALTVPATGLMQSTAGGTYSAVQSPADAQPSGNVLPSGQMVFGGVNFDRMRTPVIFKSFASTAITAGTGMTAWTPAAGKKFRLMGYSISSSVAGVIIFGDNVVGTVIARSPALAAAGFHTLGASDVGNGILSAAANNVLKLDGPTGNVAGMVWGTEE